MLSTIFISDAIFNHMGIKYHIVLLKSKYNDGTIFKITFAEMPYFMVKRSYFEVSYQMPNKTFKSILLKESKNFENDLEYIIKPFIKDFLEL